MICDQISKPHSDKGKDEMSGEKTADAKINNSGQTRPEVLRWL